MNQLPTFIASLVILLSFSTEGLCADFQKGLDAYKRGHNSIALREWRPLARQGDANAQYNLGVMYDKGHGVPRDKARERARDILAKVGLNRTSLYVVTHTCYRADRDKE